MTVTVSGKKEVVSVKLSEEVVDPDDIEMLEDLIVAATTRRSARWRMPALRPWRSLQAALAAWEAA
mgnify:CR=1 FL=1